MSWQDEKDKLILLHRYFDNGDISLANFVCEGLLCYRVHHWTVEGFTVADIIVPTFVREIKFAPCDRRNMCRGFRLRSFEGTYKCR